MKSLGTWEEDVSLYTCGYLQTRMDVVKLEGDICRRFQIGLRKRLKLCLVHLTMPSVFIGKEVELVSGISLCAWFKGPEGLYWKQHQSCFPGLSQKSRECASVTLGLTGAFLSYGTGKQNTMDSVTKSSFFRGKKQSNYTCLHFCTDICFRKVKTRKECLGWLGSITLNPSSCTCWTSLIWSC